MPEEQSTTNPYGSSNAPNYAAPVGYQVNPRTGTLQVSITPPPLFGFLGKAATPSIQYSEDASFLNKQIFHLPLGWLYSYSFILDSKIYINGGSSFFIDQDYPSGMRYYTLRDATFKDFAEPQPFPYDKARSFTSMLRLVTGDRQYIDAYGRLLGMDDRFGNHVVFEYDRDGDVVASRITRIIDSFGQATQFTYDAKGAITVTYPAGGRNTVAYSYLLDEQSYLVGYVDPLGRRSTIESQGGFVRHDLISRIVQPNGLEIGFDYGALRYYPTGGGQFRRLDCVVGVRSTSAGVTRTVSYDYDPDDTAHNFTGYPTFYVGSDSDDLLESSDNEYRYRVRIDDGILITDHVYNRLHLELETLTMTRDTRQLVSHIVKTFPGETPDQGFPLYTDLRRDYPNYQSPIRVLSEIYGDAGQKRQQVVETDFDLFGQPQEVRSYRSDSLPNPDNLLWKHATTYDYPTDTDPDHYAIVLVDERWDCTQGQPAGPVDRRTVNTLTADRKSIETSATALVNAGTFAPEKRQRYECDSRGRITYEELSWIDGQGHSPQKSQRWTTYEDQGPTFVTTRKDALNQSTVSVVDATTGWTTSVTSAVGAKASYTYDNIGRPLSEIDPTGVEMQWSYQETSGKVTTKYANGYEAYFYNDGFGDEIATADNGLPGKAERTLSTKTYNALGQLEWEQGVLGEASRIVYEYDDRGQLAKSTDRLGNVTSYSYDAATQTRTTYFNGYKVHETSSLDQVSTAYTYSTDRSDDRIESKTTIDSFDRMVLGRVSWTGANTWVEASYEYGAELDLRRYTSQGADGITGRHDMERDLFGNVQQETIEINIPGESPQSARGDFAQYNELNQLVEDRNPLGQASIYTYDAAGRQETFTNYSGTVFSSQYIANNQVESVAYLDGDGKRVEKRFGYAPLTHDLISIEELIGGVGNGAIGRSYLLDGSLESTTYPDGKKVTITHDQQYARVSDVTDVMGNKTKYGYDGWGRLHSAEIAALGQSVVFDYYDRLEDSANSGRLKSATINGGLRRTYQYDGFGSVAKITYADVRTGNSKEMFTAELTYTLPSGNLAEVVCRSVLDPEDPVLNRRTEYKYNSLNQLTCAKVTVLADGKSTTVDYRYDAANNVTQEIQTDANGVSTTIVYTFDSDNKLTTIDGPAGSVTLSYDVNGNLVDDGNGAIYSYDKKDRLIRYSQAQRGVDAIYAYYPDDLRATKQAAGSDGIRFYYDGASVPSIVNESQSKANAAYLLAGNERLLRCVQEPGKMTSKYLITGAKDVNGVLDSNLAVDAGYVYTPYGAQAPSGATPFDVNANPYQFTRQYTDAESELIYLRSRYYHPGLKRFLSRDAATLLNRYNYGNGNPINGADLMGEVFGFDDFLIGLAISAIIGAAIGAAVGGATTRSWKGVLYGALAGGVGGAVAFATGVGITYGIALAGFAVAEQSAAVGLAVGAATGAVSEAVGGVAGQEVANLAGDNGSVWQAALWGAAFGTVFGGVTGYRATFRFINAEVGSERGIQRFSRAFRDAPPAERAAMLEDVSPRVLDGMSHRTPTWRRIGNLIRRPGGQHEMLPVEHTARWRAMGSTVGDIQSEGMRTPTATTEFDMTGTGTWVAHNSSNGHPFYNAAVGQAEGVVSLHTTVRGLGNRIRVGGIIGNLPSAFRSILPPIGRLVRMTFSVAYGVQGRVRL